MNPVIIVIGGPNCLPLLYTMAASTMLHIALDTAATAAPGTIWPLCPPLSTLRAVRTMAIGAVVAAADADPRSLRWGGGLVEWGDDALVNDGVASRRPSGGSSPTPATHRSGGPYVAGCRGRKLTAVRLGWF